MDPSAVLSDAPPVSSVPYRDGYVGLAGLIVAWLVVMVLKPMPIVATWLVLFATSIPMLVCEWRRAPPATRRKAKLAPLAWVLGFVVATAPFLLVHGQEGSLDPWLTAWVVVAPLFALRFGLEFVRNGVLSGGFPVALGRALLPPHREKLRALAAPARLWALKAFFIPLYALSIHALLYMALTADLSTGLGWLALAVTFAYTIDLAFGLCGYLFASNDLAPTLRSTQRLVFGWVVCLLCYGPIHMHWPAFRQVVLTEIAWPPQLMLDPLNIAAAIAMLTLLALYVSASVHFGLRFSNLSNRGVLTAGPYRYMKHPAYFAHAANAWIICLILLPAAGIDLGLSQGLVPLSFTLLYWLRALTEEKHMSEDPDYVAYADWIGRHGLVAPIKRLVIR